MQRLYAFILLLILVTLACSAQPVAVQPDVERTKAYESDLATALAGTLAAAPAPVVEVAPTEPPTEAPSSTPVPEMTATARPTLPPLPGTRPIAYGETVGAMPRQETLLYSFEGTEDDSVLVRVVVSNARPKMPFCDNRSMRSDFIVMTEQQQTLLASAPGSNPSTTQIYTLPYTGRYYISATCRGGGCDAFCAELDVHIEKK